MYKTHDLARLAKVHPNTVRLYEASGFLSPAPRASNGYRVYSELHLLQLLVARAALRCEIVQGHLRVKARAILEASGREDFKLALVRARLYLNHLERDYARALEAVDIAEKGLSSAAPLSGETYSLKEVSRLLGVSSEIARNWERNGLLTVPRRPNGHRVYAEKEIDRMKIIRTLRAAHYSMNAVLRLLNEADRAREVNVLKTLNTPDADEDIVSVTDRLVHSLEEAIRNTREAIRLLESAKRRSPRGLA